MRKLMVSLAVVLAAAGSAHAEPSVKKNFVKGDYVEARTASVFAGACHYNGELTTAGREAVMAFRINDGQWNGTSLKNITVVAAVAGEGNLSDTDCKRHTVLYLDPKVSEKQEQAVVAALRSNCKGTFGCVLDVKRTPIRFTHTSGNYTVEAKGISTLVVDALPDNACCKMPQNVWYKPFVNLEGRKVGLTKVSRVSDKILGPAWSKSNENTAFYGSFTL